MLAYYCKKNQIACFFGFLGSMLNAGPGGPNDRGYKSTHIWIFPLIWFKT